MTATAPMMMPMLARGRHRSPRRGACFMELASYLAGEPWTDSPACTDESLAHLARLVNDLSTDDARPALSAMIPSVIGLQDLGRGFADEMALIASVHALPIAAQDRQRGIAVGMLRILGDVGGYTSHAHEFWTASARATLAQYYGIERWAREFADRMGVVGSDRSATGAMIEIAARGIAEACVLDPDDRLRELLRAGIAWAHECAGVNPAVVPELVPQHWAGVVRPA
ncbi:hypothetical protein [Ruania zhangjianzhongii]|uniref:hypothetical protein n=1 Tax=Ruania zhangjianzhongii TaxID=2603206 RepID=UPI0011CAB13C|nr:hypothetical protein [Ruania zhangjianzhongii]